MGNHNSNRHIELIDTTLRDGAQAPHVALSLDDKISIVSMLYNAGITIFEAGIPAMSPAERNDLLQLKELFPQCIFIGWCRATLEDIEHACACRCDCIHISYPVSPLHINIVNFTEQGILHSLPKLVATARKNTKSVSIGAQDASRARLPFVAQFCAAALDAGAQRIRIADTVGILTPLKTLALFKRLMDIVPGSMLEFHGHNDLGMATANTVVALESGADFASVTVNGIGERAGNAPLEEVVMAIKETTSIGLDFDTNLISSICSAVSDITNRPIPGNKPITGESVFLHKSGIHCHGLIKNRSAYEPYSAEKTGHAPTRFCAGTHSGTSGIRFMLGEYAESLSKESLQSFVEKVNKFAKNQRISLNENAIRDLFLKSLGR